MTFLSSLYQLTPTDWLLLALCASLIGFAKTGIHGASTLAIPILAAIFGGRSSTGIVLPLLCAGDIFGVCFYNRHANWKHVVRLLPWALAGLIAGLVVGSMLNDRVFTLLIATIVGSGLAVMLWQEFRKGKTAVPDSWWFAALMGLLGGFATMIGNAAGPIMALYLLAMRLPKLEYIGTAAWFFLIINLVKVPLNAFVWKSITLHSLALNAACVPAVILGALAGWCVARIVPERPFRGAIVISTALAVLKLLL